MLTLPSLTKADAWAHSLPVRFRISPAPACEITLSWGGSTVTVSALVDSGASGTLIPQSVATTLSLPKIGERRVRLFWPPRLKAIYRVDVDFWGLILQDHAVAPSEDRPYALIGRDVLNRYRTLLDGPALEFSVQ